jgi:hypothetical protein
MFVQKNLSHIEALMAISASMENPKVVTLSGFRKVTQKDFYPFPV